jgi:hypothetical protein
MVGTILAAVGVATGINLGAVDSAPPDPVGRLADAIALSRSCPSVRLDKEAVAMALARAGISIAPMVGEIAERSQAIALRYVLLGRGEACAIARERYGKTGSSAAGFLAEW